MQISRIEQMEFTSAFGVLCAQVAGAGDRNGLYPTFCRIPAGSHTLAHSHFEAELFYIIEGAGEMVLGSNRAHVRAGDLVRIPPFSEHQLRNQGPGGLIFLSVYSEDYETPELRVSGTAPVLITSAPPTPNGPLHLGHISGPYLAADVMARYLSQRSISVRRHSGTDDHQNYVAERARVIGLDTEDFRREMRARVQRGLRAMQIEHDEFIEPRSDSEYRSRVLGFVDRAIASGIIDRAEVALPYCRSCDIDLVDALADGLCPSCEEPSRGGCESCGVVVPPQDLLQVKCGRCGCPADRRSSVVFQFSLSKHLTAIEGDLSRLALSPRVREMVERVRGIKDLKVLLSHREAVASPARLGSGSATSGLPLVGTDQVLHVWFEMAAHYESFAMGDQTWIHCFGFDNSFYYLLFIPALLRAMNSRAKLPDVVAVNEFLLLDGEKFSTSRGHAIWADEADVPSDHLRLYLCLNRPAPRASDFSIEAFQQFSETLSAQLNELKALAAARIRIQTLRADPGILVDCNRFTRDMERYLSPELFDGRRAAHCLLGFIDHVLQTCGHDLNSGSNSAPAPSFVASASLMLRVLATAMAPIMPAESENLLSLLGEDSRSWCGDWAATWSRLAAGGGL